MKAVVVLIALLVLGPSTVRAQTALTINTEPNAIAVMPSDTTTEHPLCIGWKPRLHASKDGHDGPIKGQ